MPPRMLSADAYSRRATARDGRSSWFARPTRRLRAERRRNPSCSTASRWIRAEEMMMTARLGIAIAFAALVLVGCGTTQDDRAISGGAIGAGAGAVAGALTGNPGAGALLGGAAGASLGGAFTSPNQIDLGEPAWK